MVVVLPAELRLRAPGEWQSLYKPRPLAGCARRKGAKAPRVVRLSTTLEGAGGSLESLHFGFGSADAYEIADAPDNVTAAAVALTNLSGAAEVRTVVLLTREEVDAAAEKSVSYTPPGG